MTASLVAGIVAAASGGQIRGQAPRQCRLMWGKLAANSSLQTRRTKRSPRAIPIHYNLLKECLASVTLTLLEEIDVRNVNVILSQISEVTQ